MKNPVKNIIKTKTLEMPKMNDSNSVFDFEFTLTATKIGSIGRIHGDNTEITPVKKELKEIFPFKSPLNYLKIHRHQHNHQFLKVPKHCCQ